PPKFEEKHKTIHAKRGEIAKLPCDAIGDKPLTVSWTKDGKPLMKRGIDYSYEIIDLVTDRGMISELIIESVRRSDNAEYKCVAENEFGTDQRKIVFVVIEVPSQPTNLKVKESWSRSASINWSPPFDGHSRISKYTIQYWIHKASSRKLHKITTTNAQTTALINDLKPGQSYEVTVIAENDVGIGEASESVVFTTNKEGKVLSFVFELIVIITSEPSGPPMDISVKPAGPTSIKVSWKAPPKDQWNGDLEGYYIGYKAVGSNQPFSFRSEVSTPNKDSTYKYEFFLTNLLKATSYDIVLKAFNSAGSGPQSHEMRVKTLDGDLPSAPNAFVVSSTKTSVTLSWNAQENQSARAPVIGYIIHYQLENDDWRQIPVPSNSMNNDGLSKSSTYTFVVDGLNSGMRYNLFVTATNKHGEGDPSAIVVAKTGGDKLLSAFLGGFNMPYYFQPMFVIPIVSAVVIIFIVLVVTFVCVRRLKHPVIPDERFHTLNSKQFAYTGTTQRYVDFENSKPLMNESGNPYPFAYSTMPMDNGENPRKHSVNTLSTPIHRHSLNKLDDDSHVYDNPQ
ncbi:Down syndrome cell adhesion molecule-like protein 1, partial [Leptotrombidium deliense]